MLFDNRIVDRLLLSRRDKKIAQLYEQGVSKRRIGLYLARWIGWATITPLFFAFCFLVSSCFCVYPVSLFAAVVNQTFCINGHGNTNGFSFRLYYPDSNFTMLKRTVTDDGLNGANGAVFAKKFVDAINGNLVNVTAKVIEPKNCFTISREMDALSADFTFKVLTPPDDWCDVTNNSPCAFNPVISRFSTPVSGLASIILLLLL